MDDETRDGQDGLEQDSVDQDSRSVSTPEGDNEFSFDEPLTPSEVESNVEGLQRWPSNSAMEADKQRTDREKDQDKEESKNATSHTGLEHVIDEISTGKILPG